MAADYYGKTSDVIYLGTITGEQFAKAYKEIASSKDKVPKASTILPVTGVGGCRIYAVQQLSNEHPVETDKPVIEAWIFYDILPQDNRTLEPKTGKVIEKSAEPKKPALVVDL